MTSSFASLDRLWALAGQRLPEDGPAIGTRFDPIGLLLSLPLEPSIYHSCAPSNVLSFATTRGNGVHFSLLLLDGVVSEDSPVVMTVPMAADENTNVIVGENLRDFLALGCRRGYFILEQLAYDPDWVLTEFADNEFGEDLSEKERALLVTLGDAFDLRPWGHRVAGRLAWLKSEFFPLLALPPTSSPAHAH